MATGSKLKIGVFVDNLLLQVREAIAKTAEMGADGFQLYVTKGEMLAENMDAAARKDFVKFYKGLGLTLSALCADFWTDLADPEQQAKFMPKLKAAADQAVDLGARILTLHIGHCKDAVSDTRVRFLNELGKYASERGVVFATETGLESGATLREVLKKLDTDGIRVNFDPANLVMRGFDHLQAARDLAPYVMHSHAKDGRKGVLDEVPLGQGDVHYPEYIALWRSLGYDGFFTIEREAGDDRVGDVRKGIELLRSL